MQKKAGCGSSSSSRRDNDDVKHFMIEIAPDTWMRYRGEEESKACLRHDNFRVGVRCRWCPMEDICCIEDADYVICPSCKVVSPNRSAESDESGADEDVFSGPNASSGQGGVALGFTWEDLFEWMSEIKQEDCRKQQQQPMTSEEKSEEESEEEFEEESEEEDDEVPTFEEECPRTVLSRASTDSSFGSGTSRPLLV